LNKAKETIKALQGAHSALFVVAATAIALLSTSQTSDYGKALEEGYQLRSLQMSDYEQFARLATPGNYLLPKSQLFTSGDWMGEIVAFLNAKLGWDVHTSSFPRHEIQPILHYPAPPTSGMVKDWFDWKG
jgi:hypothetical protein